MMRLTSSPKPLSFILCTRDGRIPSFRSDSNYGPLHHPQQCLLYAFSANITCLPIPTVPASGQFVRFIYVNNSGTEEASIEELGGDHGLYLALCVSQFADCSWLVVNNGITKEQRYTHQSIYTQLYIVPNICRDVSAEISPENALDRVRTACLCESVSQYCTKTHLGLVRYLRK